MNRRRLSLWVLFGILFALLFAAACGDDGTAPGQSVPSISNLHFSPDFVYITSFPDEGLSVSGSVDFQDDDGDLATLWLTTSAGTTLELPLDDAAGLTRGTIQGSLLIPPSGVGEIQLRVWVEDAAGHRSNILTGNFGVRIDDTAEAWTLRPSGIPVQLNSVHRCGDGFLAVGYGGTILGSVDGIAWSPRATGTASVLWDVAANGSLQVAVGDEGAILTSTDGTAWTDRSYSDPTATLYSVAWSGSVFVAVGSISGLEPTQILISPDGADWEPRPAIAGLREFRAVTWSGNRFVALGTAHNDSTYAAVSVDGVSWQVTARLGPVFPRDLCWTGSRYVGVGGTGSVLVSPDGTAWEIIPTESPGLYGVVWTGDRLVAVGTGVYRSSDGLQWVQMSQEQGLWGVAWTGLRYIAVGFAGTILTSP